MAAAMLTLAACDASLPGIGNKETPKSLTAMDGTGDVPGTIFLAAGGRIWKLKGGRLQALTPGDQRWSYPAVTTDGGTTAAAMLGSGHAEVAIGGADFGGLKALTTPPKDLSKASIDIKPAFSPDGKRLAFMSDRSNCCTDEAIWEGTYSPYKPRQVSTPPDYTGGDDEPAYLPDGSALLFSAWRPVDGDSRNVHAGLMQAGVPSGRSKTLLAPRDGDTMDPAPGPGGRLVFVMRRGGTSDLDVGGIDGAGATAVTSFGDVRQPAWSPDGKSLVFISQHGGTLDLWMVSADGKGDPRRLTWGADLDANSRPAWIG